MWPTLGSRTAKDQIRDPYPWGSPYPRQSPGLPWGRNFYSHTHTHGDPHTHGRVQGCRGDGISIPIPIPMEIPIPTADLLLAQNWRIDHSDHEGLDPPMLLPYRFSCPCIAIGMCVYEYVCLDNNVLAK